MDKRKILEWLSPHRLWQSKTENPANVGLSNEFALAAFIIAAVMIVSGFLVWWFH